MRICLPPDFVIVSPKKKNKSSNIPQRECNIRTTYRKGYESAILLAFFRVTQS